ncbi:MAG: hypothetical protein HY801_09175, partial [Candidatus Lindowbacteria bacterium]|nr:hypothetical protein [Candidatus Lindowbacteria bacterium]
DGLGGWTTTLLLDTTLSIATFGEDEAGELYVADHSPLNGAIYRVTAVSTLSSITLRSPPKMSTQTTPPTFEWTADGGTNNGFAVDLSSSPFFTTFWSTRENLHVTLASTNWAMPLSIWNRIPAGSQVFWRVRGADLDQQPLTVVKSAQIWSFFKQ